MNKGYWIVRADVNDLDAFKHYASKTPDVLEKFGGTFLSRAGQHQAVEGSTRLRNSLIEFPSYQAALDCWHSDEYQAVREIRLAGSELDIVVLEGTGL